MATEAGSLYILSFTLYCDMEGWIPGKGISRQQPAGGGNIFQATFLLLLSHFSRVQFSATSWPGSSVHGIFQARILEWVAIPFSKGPFWPRDQTQVSCIAGRFFTIWATREAYGLSHTQIPFRYLKVPHFILLLGHYSCYFFYIPGKLFLSNSFG